MLLAIDIGNTNIVLGLFTDEKLVHKFRLETNLSKPADEYAVDIVELFLNNKIDCLKITSAVIASVVPNLTETIEKAVKKFCNGEVLVVGQNLKLDIEIAIKNKSEVGFDRLINAIAGYKKLGGNLIIVDFGTATTFDVVGEKGEYLGGVIAPGVNLSIKALHDMTAQLPKIQVKSQKNVIGKSTFEAMNSGIYFGYISLAEGLIAKIKAEYAQSYQTENKNNLGLGGDPCKAGQHQCAVKNKMKTIITGGLGSLFSNAIANDGVFPDLTLEGLRIVSKI